MKKILLMLLFSAVHLFTMHEQNDRRSGMQTLEAIKATTVCCINICNTVDACTGRESLNSLSRGIDEYYNNPHLDQKPSLVSIICSSQCMSYCSCQRNKK